MIFVWKIIQREKELSWNYNATMNGKQKRKNKLIQYIPHDLNQTFTSLHHVSFNFQIWYFDKKSLELLMIIIIFTKNIEVTRDPISLIFHILVVRN